MEHHLVAGHGRRHARSGIATFASVRSANKAARVAERALQIGLRPILAPSRTDDAPLRVMFGDRHWVTLEGGKAAVDVANGAIYLAMLLRNVGNGVGIIEAWAVAKRDASPVEEMVDESRFRDQTRDLWIPPGDVAFWQGALRDTSERSHAIASQAVAAGELLIDLRYRDHEGGQRMVSRFILVRREGEGDEAGGGWIASLGNHRSLD